ncbi:MAG TPA: hypothetical protein VMZ66_03960 [Aeromicrobium sp.]|nr:hypothetical protein [Aeromicrobium sp.]
MTTTATGGRAAIAARTLRTDRWWFPPAIQAAGLTAWVAYATFRVFQQSDYFVDKYNYLTPFYSPCVSTKCVDEASHFGEFLPYESLGFVAHLIPFAAVSLPFLLLFRLTCYYYRKAYYRAFWLSPPACAVAEPHAKYSGETRFPLIVQNLHRYFFYAAILISLINTYDAINAHRLGGVDGAGGGFGLGLGNIILWINVILLWAYTASCHSCRSIIGGKLNHFSKHPVRYSLWQRVSFLNGHHMLLAWITLGTLALTDFYIMGLAAGWYSDLRFIG